MVLYQPHVNVEGEEAEELDKKLRSLPKNEAAAKTLRKARMQRPNAR